MFIKATLVQYSSHITVYSISYLYIYGSIYLFIYPSTNTSTSVCGTISSLIESVLVFLSSIYSARILII